jgi:hypothetical protein
MERSRILVLLLAVAAASAVPVLSTMHQASAQESQRRYGEVVVLEGADAAPFLGATPDELWVWSWHADGSWHRQPMQLDEREAGVGFVGSEDGALDEDDQLVFPLDPAGVAKPPGAWPPGLGRSHPPLEVRVTDPLDPDLEAYMYVFLARQGPESVPAPLVTYDRSTRELASDTFVLGFADSFSDDYVGFKSLSLFESATDVIDRLKIRVKVSALGIEMTITEENLDLINTGDMPSLDPDPVIIGPVRVVFDATGGTMGYQTRYEMSLAGLSDIQLPVGFQLLGVRSSLDFSEASLPATYTDANEVDGVAIDGQPDRVADRPVPVWREVAMEDGRVVLLSKVESSTGTARVYYMDNDELDVADTGDGKSYGDNGVSARDTASFERAGFPWQVVIVPPDSEITAAMLAENAETPLVVEVTVGQPPETATPGEPTQAPTTTPLPSVTMTSTATLSPSATTPVPEITPTLEITPTPQASATPGVPPTAEPTDTSTPPIASPTAPGETATSTSPAPEGTTIHLPYCTRGSR